MGLYNPGNLDRAIEETFLFCMPTHDNTIAARARRVVRLKDGHIIHDTGRDGPDLQVSQAARRMGLASAPGEVAV